MGNPSTRDPEQVARDVRDELVSTEYARSIYRVAVDHNGMPDWAATKMLRA
jgi:N-methylhydantoinase B